MVIKYLPTNVVLKDKTQYFWWVSHPDWGGLDVKRRIRKSYKDARRLSNLVGYVVNWDNDQTSPPKAPPGSQGAFTYGASRKKKKTEIIATEQYDEK